MKTTRFQMLGVWTRGGDSAGYNVTGALRASSLKVSAMWYAWSALLVVSCCAAAPAGGAVGSTGTATTRAPPRTLDRQAAELAWRTWLQSPESNNQNAPPRRIITKSLFITPLNCPEGQRIDRDGCVKLIPVDKSEHERLLLNQLNAFFTASPGAGDVVYDYGEDEPGPLQLSIPINLDAQAAPLQGQEPSAQAQNQHENYVKVDKKPDKNSDIGSSLEAELELLQLQHSNHMQNDTTSAEGTDILNHNVLLPFDKPKRDSPLDNSSEATDNVDSEKGQKEEIYGQINIDPILLLTETTTGSGTEQPTTFEAKTEQSSETAPTQDNAVANNKSSTNESADKSTVVQKETTMNNSTEVSNSTEHTLKKDSETKLNPENDYADIGEAIKLISRYAEVTTDDNFSKDRKKYAIKDDNVLGTRTKLQYRRNKVKPVEGSVQGPTSEHVDDEKVLLQYGTGGTRPKNDVYYRYPWQGTSINSPTPPPDYPFRHIQDYWQGQSRVGGVYNTAHENPRRHHHNFPHNLFRPHGLPYGNYPMVYPGVQQVYPGNPFARQAPPPHGALQSYSNNQDLYSLLGLKHWFSSERTSKR